jgi:hypothetical protein
MKERRHHPITEDLVFPPEVMDGAESFTFNDALKNASDVMHLR